VLLGRVPKISDATLSGMYVFHLCVLQTCECSGTFDLKSSKSKRGRKSLRIRFAFKHAIREREREREKRRITCWVFV
jgi:hypothetical protein